MAEIRPSYCRCGGALVPCTACNNEPRCPKCHARDHDYMIEPNPKAITGCSLDRAFPYIIRNRAGDIVQYAKSDYGAWEWVRTHTLPDPAESSKFHHHKTK